MDNEVRAHILEVALGLFAEKGLSKTSMNDIVRASGLSKGGVYWHFASKEALILAVYEQFFERQTAALSQILAEENTSATERLMRLGALGGGELAGIMTQFPSPLEFYAQAMDDPALQELLVHFLGRYRNLVEELVTQGMNSGEWRQVDSRAAANTLIALIEGVLLVWVIAPEQSHLDEQLEASVNFLLEGLKRHERES
ncbi:MAG: TetR/AcrR family transcriptional regulator [Anaerolineae bacterium]|nr:TetR/AcrR family transcriptional regulator [Anaerolineae bacterium]MCA9909626.1 TetR/AcrR family transcriptional regulator [Anaerolineae bacterium]